MPSGETLRKPEGTDYWNARYYLYVAEHLGEAITAEVDAYRVTPEPYSSDLNAAMRAYEEFRKRGWRMIDLSDAEDRWCSALWHRDYETAMGNGDTPVAAICAALIEAGARN